MIYEELMNYEESYLESTSQKPMNNILSNRLDYLMDIIVFMELSVSV
jgi:hypothetical protein